MNQGALMAVLYTNYSKVIADAISYPTPGTIIAYQKFC